MNNFSKYSVLIIGLGNIGMGYDLHQKSKEIILTHAKSFNLNHNFKLVGGVDLRVKTIKIFEKIYKVKGFTNIKEAMISLRPDLVIIASPTELHYVNIKEVFEYGEPKIVLCEKPLSYKLKESQEIVNLFKNKETRLFVNYFRRVLPANLEIFSLFNSNEFSVPFKGVCIYSKGLYNSASHFINLFQFFFGEVKDIKIINKNNNKIKLKFDPEPDFQLNFQNGKIVFISNDNSLFINNSELIMKNGRLSFEEGGNKVLWKGIKKDKRFSGYEVLGDNSRLFNNDFNKIQYYVAEQIHLAMQSRKNSLCTFQEALNTQEIMEQIQIKL